MEVRIMRPAAKNTMSKLTSDLHDLVAIVMWLRNDPLWIEPYLPARMECTRFVYGCEKLAQALEGCALDRTND